MQAFTFLCGTQVLPSLDMMIVEYFCDKEKTELHPQHTKELQVEWQDIVILLGESSETLLGVSSDAWRQ